MKEVKYTYHHTASDRGYIPVGKEIKEPYKGKYGRRKQVLVLVQK